MDVGRYACRYGLTIALLVTMGCNAVPPSARVTPRTADISTRSGTEALAVTATEVPTEPEAKPKLAFDSLDEISPLPPALQRVENLDEPPPSLTVLPKTLELPITESPSGPPADVHVKLASLTFDEAAKPVPVVTSAPPAPTPLPTATPLPPAEPKPEPKPEPAKKTSEEIWREGVQALRAVAHDRVQTAATAGGPNWMVRERLLGWLAEPDIDPDARTADDVARSRSILKGLAAVLDAKDPNRAAEIRDAIATLEAQAPLEITELKICRMVHGFGNIEALEPPVRKGGQSVVLYCELAGLAYEPASAGYRSRVSAEVELLPERADTPMWTHALGTAEDACRKRRRDFFVGHKFTLPESISPGKYRLRLTEKDLVADHVATRETVITIGK